MHRYEHDEKCPSANERDDIGRRGRWILGALLAVVGLSGVLSYLDSRAAVTSEWQVILTRGSSSTPLQVVKGATRAAAESACESIVPQTVAAAVTYTCGAARQVFVVTPAAVTCPSAPAPRSVACPSGSTGSWTQTATVGAAPSCAVTWAPAAAPAGACTPIVVEPAPGTATLSWIAPTSNTDGSALTDLAGYRIIYGTSGAMAYVVQVGPNVSRHTLTGLTADNWYFSVKAFNSGGLESAPSNVVTRTVR